MVDQLVGVWVLGGYPFEIKSEDGGYVGPLPGAPHGFEPRLEPTADPARFVLRGGTMDGTEFAVTDSGVTVGPIAPIRLSEPYVEPPATDCWRRRSPPIRSATHGLSSSRRASGTAQCWTGTAATPSIRWCSGSLHRIATSSTAPRRPTFAVVDRANLEGSIRNGASTFEAPDGRTMDTYQFSVHHEMLSERPFTAGALYVLPRESFRQLPMWPGGPLSNEWASETSVRPLTRLLVEPEDFPFLDEVGGHDDGPLLRLQVLM